MHEVIPCHEAHVSPSEVNSIRRAWIRWSPPLGCAIRPGRFAGSTPSDEPMSSINESSQLSEVINTRNSSTCPIKGTACKRTMATGASEMAQQPTLTAGPARGIAISRGHGSRGRATVSERPQGTQGSSHETGPRAREKERWLLKIRMRPPPTTLDVGHCRDLRKP